MIEQGAFRVSVTLTTVIDFSPIERDKPLSSEDAIGNAQGTVSDEVWKALEDEGWTIEFEAERTT